MNLWSNSTLVKLKCTGSLENRSQKEPSLENSRDKTKHVKFSEHLNCMNGVRGSTCQDCFPKIAHACIREVDCIYRVSSY